MRIFVRNLSPDIREADLQEVFGAFGQVTSVTVLRYRHTGEPRGEGFVEMPEDSEARSAITGLNHQIMRGQIIMLNEARDQGANARGRTALPAWT